MISAPKYSLSSMGLVHGFAKLSMQVQVSSGSSSIASIPIVSLRVHKGLRGNDGEVFAGLACTDDGRIRSLGDYGYYGVLNGLPVLSDAVERNGSMHQILYGADRQVTAISILGMRYPRPAPPDRGIVFWMPLHTGGEGLFSSVHRAGLGPRVERLFYVNEGGLVSPSITSQRVQWTDEDRSLIAEHLGRFLSPLLFYADDYRLAHPDGYEPRYRGVLI